MSPELPGPAGPAGVPGSPAEVRGGLERSGYLADDAIATAVYLADRLAKPVLVEGPAGTGKTELAKCVAAMAGLRLVRLQCYEGLEESKVLYEWDYRKQLLAIQAGREGLLAGTSRYAGAGTAGVAGTGAAGGAGTGAAGGASRGLRGSWAEVEHDLFSEEFLLARPLLSAIRSSSRVVLLVDEVDRIELETEALLLEVLSDYQVSIPELGTVLAASIPLVFLTSNDTRELSEALKRRCLYLHLDYPTRERELAIVRARLPGIDVELAEEVVRVVESLRALELEKRPSISETLDWARALVLLGVVRLDQATVLGTLNLVLKHRGDLELATRVLGGHA